MNTDDSYEVRVAAILKALKIPADYPQVHHLPLWRLAAQLVEVGKDTSGRVAQLMPQTAIEWRNLQAAAHQDGVILNIVSTYRTLEDQQGIIQRKLDLGQSILEILRFSAPPGYSEHHTGRALDLSTRGCEQLSEKFENTTAFKWLVQHAGDYGFSLSYPRDNQYGFAYEPWHWAARA